MRLDQCSELRPGDPAVAGACRNATSEILCISALDGQALNALNWPYQRESPAAPYMSDTKASAATLPITAARAIVTCPGRNFVTLKIETANGLYGLGDATLNGRELAVASYLTDHVIPTLIGKDAHQIEDIWQYLYRGAYWRRGAVTMSALAAIDTAL